MPMKAGRVRIELPELAENGNRCRLKLTVDSPMTPADHVKMLYVFSEKNPPQRRALPPVPARAWRVQPASARRHPGASRRSPA
jgi:sulfur-oxidizing protein SoxY